ncbi:hypothetical protein JX265_003415 [Neoarthrinium moseri]|uniref:Origin recognition complex subunit 4 n=1 Tax=Neoarthrinium moseri TaxID=1658444 RepID=A0A9P9WRS9_9PEZI|nr:hypothetical protein JX265_003415 [Neoarthrinium moseri]
MAPETGLGRRKRARPQSDQDSTAPEPNVTTTSSAKKPRLDGDATSSPAPPNGFSAFTSAIGNVFGFGRKASAQGAAKAKRQNGKTASAYDDIPSSSDEGRGAPTLQKGSRPAVSITKPKKPAKSLRQAQKNDVYDVPSSGDEHEIPSEIAEQSNTQDKASRSTKQANGPVKRPGTTRKSTGRPRGGHAPDNDTAEQEEEAEEEVPQGTPSRTRGRRPAVKQLAGPGARSGQKTTTSKQPPPTPKGILTPRHKKRGRPRKSVAFNSEDNKPAAEVFFDDLPVKSKARGGRLNQTDAPTKGEEPEIQASEGEDDEESEDDEVCAICGKPDSEAPNEIIFCENCDKAVHQKCYNVPVIPDDDWFCKDCLQEDVISGTNGSSAVHQVSESAELPDIPNFEQHLQTMQRVLIDRCSGNRRIKLKGQEEAYEKAYQLVEQTVLAGEGNSMMVIGARGCGKTLLVESIVRDLVAENHDSFHVVRLNGFIHTDDKLALKEIWRQLGKEMEVEDDMNKTSNYADTLASLLALLSHPSEITGADDGVTSKSVVFVIDEFDLFATHARQTLLYNLFDIAQARKAPIAVLGLTTRVDVVESLEKRVKSRFSHRYVHLSLPKSLLAYWDICKQGLLVDKEDLETEGFDLSLDGLDEFRAYWDQQVEALYKAPSFQDHLEYHFYTTKSVAGLLTTFILPLSALSATSPRLKIPSSPALPGLDAPDSKLHLLAALSDLDLALLIAAARLDIVAHTDTVNFAMAYDEYSSQMGKQRLQSASSGMVALGAGGRVWGRAVAIMAWERLVSLGILIPAGIGGRSNAIHGGLEGKMWKLDVSLEEIPAAVELPGFLVKWCTQI